MKIRDFAIDFFNLDVIGNIIHPQTQVRTLDKLKAGELRDVVLLHRKDLIDIGDGFCPLTNVPRFDDFSTFDTWGYHGTGPSCLSANILYHFLRGDEKTVEKLKVDFIREIVSKIPMDESFVLKKDVILAWIDHKTKVDSRA